MVPRLEPIPMKLLIFEPCSAGHRLQYVRVIIDAFQDAAVEIVVVAEKTVSSSAEYGAHLKAVEDRFCLDPSVSRVTGTGLKLWGPVYRMFHNAVKRHQPDHVFIPFGDGITQVMGVVRLLGINPIKAGVRFDTVLFRGKTPGEGKTIRDRIGSLIWQIATASAGADAYHLLNPFQYEAILQRGFKPLARRCVMLPEPVEKIEKLSISQARQRLSIPENGKFIACLGRLDRRKGADLMIKAFAKASLGDNDRLLMFGAMDPDIKSMLENEYKVLVRRGQLIVIDRYLSQKELEAALCAADVICTPYPNHMTSSGFVVRAAALGKPVLAADVGWMGKIVPVFGLGDTCDVTDASIFSEAIQDALNKAEFFTLTQYAKQFVAYHSIENCYAHWRATLPAKLQTRRPQGLLSWDNVRPHHVDSVLSEV